METDFEIINNLEILQKPQISQQTSDAGQISPRRFRVGSKNISNQKKNQNSRKLKKKSDEFQDFDQTNFPK